MAILPRDLEKRQFYNGCDSYGYYYDNGNCTYSGWSAYGRWVLLAAIIIGAFLIFLIFSCLTARRRRRQGLQPYRFTGWAGGNAPPGHANAQYTGYGQNNYNNTSAPPYGESAGYYSSQGNQGGYQGGYFGGQQQGHELQQPHQAYRGAGEENAYAPPSGPPPGKK